MKIVYRFNRMEIVLRFDGSEKFIIMINDHDRLLNSKKFCEVMVMNMKMSRTSKQIYDHVVDLMNNTGMSSKIISFCYTIK